jgi:3-oxoacyl-[acyl-carrier protein] reductase
VYAACKAGLQMLSNVMAREFSSLNITSNVIGISAFESEMLQQLDQSNLEKVMQQLPISRKAEIEDITNVLDFFISRHSSYITAQTVYLAGAH